MISDRIFAELENVQHMRWEVPPQNSDNPARTRTWKNRTKICCVANYTTGFWVRYLVISEAQAHFAELEADFVQ
jgi:hypothetical protein